MTKKEFMAYWDEWHAQWFKSIKNEELIKIGSWPLPKTKSGKDIKANKSKDAESSKFYYPEPYYCRKIDEEIHAVFLSINPGGGGEDQFFSNLKSPLIKEYKKNKQSYNSTLPFQLDNSHGLKKFFTHREDFAKGLLIDVLKSEDVNILNADLVPWHTSNQSVMPYC